MQFDVGASLFRGAEIMGVNSFGIDSEFKLGAFVVSPVQNLLTASNKNIKIEPMVMEVLTVLARRQGEVVPRGELINYPSSNQISPILISKNLASSDESLTRAISILRKAFKDNDPNNKYIETVPKRGYRLAPKVVFTNNVQDKNGAIFVTSPKKNIASYELYLQGRSLNERPFHTDALVTSEALLKQAIEIDKDYADAHTELGNCYSLMSTYLQDGDKQALIKEAATSAKRALAIDPNAAFAMTLIALEDFTKGNIVGAMQLTEKAISIDPNNSDIVMRLGYFYAAIGQIQKAIPYIEQAVKTNPTQGRNFQILATVKLCNGNLEEADRHAKRAIDMQHHFSCETYAAIAFARGDYEEAGKRLIGGRQYLSEFLGEYFHNDAIWDFIISSAYSPDQNVRETFGKMMMKMLYDPNKPPSIPLAQAIVRTGPPSAFFKIMGDTPPAGTHGTLLCIWGDTDACLRIRNDKEFMPFAMRMGMVDAWEKYGKPDCLA